MIVDRDRAEIGVCTQIWTDDDTGHGEWAAARMGANSLLVPLIDASEDGDDRVRVVVRRDEVMLAPAIGDRQRLTEDDEERLYRHFGIGDEEDEEEMGEMAAGRGAMGAPGWTGARPERDPVVVASLIVTGLAVLISIVAYLTRRRRARE